MDIPLKLLHYKLGVHLLNYRGYGGSSGQPTEEGIYSDALYLFDKVQEIGALNRNTALMM